VLERTIAHMEDAHIEKSSGGYSLIVEATRYFWQGKTTNQGSSEYGYSEVAYKDQRSSCCVFNKEGTKRCCYKEEGTSFLQGNPRRNSCNRNGRFFRRKNLTSLAKFKEGVESVTFFKMKKLPSGFDTVDSATQLCKERAILEGANFDAPSGYTPGTRF
jgi:hypothetical protein